MIQTSDMKRELIAYKTCVEKYLDLNEIFKLQLCEVFLTKELFVKLRCFVFLAWIAKVNLQ
jgi:hypothetical protein